MNKIAFLITVYKNDKIKYFKEAISSIINQNIGFQNINIYLGIDGELPKDIQAYINSNKNIFYKIIQNKHNLGLAKTLNKLIEILEDEEFIFRMDADDICRSDRVEKTLMKFQEYPQVMVIGSDMIDIDENGNEMRYKKMPTQMDEIITYAISRNPLNHPTVALRREFFDIVGKYDESFSKSQDYELWTRALKMGIKITNINEGLLYFRTTDTFFKKRNSIANNIAELRVSFSMIIYYKKYPEVPKVFAKFLVRIAPTFVGRVVYNIVRK